MIRLLVHFADTEDDGAVVLNESHIPPEVLVTGTRVILYEPEEVEMRCEAIVRRGKVWPWVAEIIEGTFRN